MPRYHALETAVTISTWDPREASQTTSDRPSTIHESAPEMHLPAPTELDSMVSKTSRVHREGPAAGHVAHDLQEDYFKGHEGVDFIAGSMPFFLVRAGGNLFKEPARLQSRDRHADDSNFQSASPSVQLDLDSSLSSIPSSRFDSPSSGLDEPKDDEVEAEVEATTAGSTEPTDFNHEPLTAARPIQVVVDISHKSFMHSLFTNTRQELCINIFFNGELAQSRIVKQACLHGPIDNDKFQVYSGRRVDSHLEVPWVIIPDGSDQSMEVGITKSASLEATWNHINQLLLVEADEWGHHGKCRSIMGEYLEQLSKRALPNSLKTSTVGEQSRAGIIDVVIALGKSVAINAAGLRAPHRKLHEDYTGKDKRLIIVPKEKRPNKREQTIINVNQVSNMVEETLDNIAAPGLPKRYIGSSEQKQRVPAVKSARTMQFSDREFGTAVKQTKHTEGENFKILKGQISPASSMLPPQKPPKMVDSLTSLPLSFGWSSTAPLTPAREHLRKPKSLPQKKFEGPDPGENRVEEVDLPKASYSLRSRSFSVSDGPSTPGQQSVTDQQSPEGASNDKVGILFAPKNKIISASAHSQGLLKILTTPTSVPQNSSSIQPTHTKVSAYDASPIASTSTLKYLKRGSESQNPPISSSNSLTIEDERAKFASNTSLSVKPRLASTNVSKRLRSKRTSSVALSETSNQPVEKKQRPASRSMSARDLGGLFVAHEPSMSVDEPLGVSFRNSTRSSQTSNQKPGVQSTSLQKDSFDRSHELFIHHDMDVFQDSAQTLSGDTTRWTLPEIANGSGTLHMSANPEPILQPSLLQGKSNKNTGLLISEHKGKDKIKFEQVSGAHSVLAPAPTKTLLSPVQSRLSRSYSKRSRGLELPKPGKDAEELSQPPKISARGLPKRIFAFSEAASDSKVASSLSGQHSNPTPRRINSVASGESITVDLVSDQSPESSQKNQSRSWSSPKVLPDASQPWKPNAICENSVLRYAKSADWPGTKMDKKTKMPVRTIKAEREGVFRATGVLMGVRFVIGI